MQQLSTMSVSMNALVHPTIGTFVLRPVQRLVCILGLPWNNEMFTQGAKSVAVNNVLKDHPVTFTSVSMVMSMPNLGQIGL